MFSISLILIEVNYVHNYKEYFKIDVNVSGNDNVLIEVQPLNAYDPIDVIPPHDEIDSNFVQPSNEFEPIDVNVSGNEIVVNEVQPLNAWFPIVCTLDIVIVVNAVHPLNA